MFKMCKVLQKNYFGLYLIQIKQLWHSALKSQSILWKKLMSKLYTFLKGHEKVWF